MNSILAVAAVVVVVGVLAFTLTRSGHRDDDLARKEWGRKREQNHYTKQRRKDGYTVSEK